MNPRGLKGVITHLGICGLGLGVYACAVAPSAVDERIRVTASEAWAPVVFDVEGPGASETGVVNPFADYRFDVLVTFGERSWRAPGFFAACGDAAETGCSEGDVWRAYFTPGAAGVYDYEIVFLSGEDVAIGGVGEAVGGLDGQVGQFTVTPTALDASVVRRRGRAEYTGHHYLQFADSGELLFKAGADAPENFLAYDGFDGTPNAKGFRKHWRAHLDDANPPSADFDWGDERGRAILGAVDYLADTGANALSFLTFSLGGDDQNVFPHLLRVEMSAYETLDPAAQWEEGVYQDRFDVSKLEQWARVLSYANERGHFLHFKLQETENDALMDGGDTGRERKLYLREIIARFSHFLALNWNAGEENTQTTDQQRDMMEWIDEIDPYGHLRVLHTYPTEKERYAAHLGVGGALTGVSLQGRRNELDDIRGPVIEWRSRSAASGRPWVVAFDEPGRADGGVGVDAAYPDESLPSARQFDDNRDDVRRRILWNVLTAGGAGVEYYFGYETGCSDLDCQDYRTRASKWADAARARRFFDAHIGRDALSMAPLDALSTSDGVFVFAAPGEKYLLFFSDAEETQLDLKDAPGAFTVRSFSVSSGEGLEFEDNGVVEGGGLVLVRPQGSGEGERPEVVLLERTER